MAREDATIAKLRAEKQCTGSGRGATGAMPIDACQVPLVSSFIQLNSYLRQRGDYFKRREVDFLLSRLIGRGGLRSEWSERCA